MIGHTKFWVKVILPRQEELIGGNVWTKIIKVDKWHVEGIIVPPPKSYSWVWILATFIIVLAYLLV